MLTNLLKWAKEIVDTQPVILFPEEEEIFEEIECDIRHKKKSDIAKSL